MGCAGWSRPLPPVPVNPRIQIQPRHLLASQPHDVKLKERDRLIVRIGQKRVDFRGVSCALNKHGLEVLRNVAEVLLEYPELDLIINSDRTRTSRSSSKREFTLATERAEVCKERLLELGVLSELHVAAGSINEDEEYFKSQKESFLNPTPQGSARTDCYGSVCFRATQAQLLEPQARLDMMLSRTGFDFLPKTTSLNDRGLITVATVARVLKETTNRITIAVPRKSSELALERAEVIAQAFVDEGVQSEILVELAKGNQKYATIRIEQGDLVKELGPQDKLADILKEMPLVFRPNSAELMNEVLPAIKRCAEVLKGINRKDVSVLVEAYSSAWRPGVSQARVSEAMLLRAERVAAWLQAEGVAMPLIPKGYPVPHAADSNNNSGKIGNGKPGATRVVLTLIGPHEDSLLPEDNDEREAICLSGTGNILNCL